MSEKTCNDCVKRTSNGTCKPRGIGSAKRSKKTDPACEFIRLAEKGGAAK